MIRSFDGKATARVWKIEGSRELGPEIERAAQRKLEVLDGAE